MSFFLKIKGFFRSCFEVMRISFSVLCQGRLAQEENLTHEGFVHDELTRHVQQVGDIEACGCRKCVKFLLRRNEELEKENAEFRQIWARLYGPYKGPPKKLSCYVVRDASGKKIS